MTDFTARSQSTEGGCSGDPSLLGEQRSPTPGLAGSRQRLTERITEVLARHEATFGGEGCDCGWYWDSREGRNHFEHVAHLIAQVAEEHYRPRIETPKQLDELSAGTVIKIGESEGGLYEKDRSGYWGYAPWRGEAQTIVDDARHEEQSIRVVWSPGAGE